MVKAHEKQTKKSRGCCVGGTPESNLGDANTVDGVARAPEEAADQHLPDPRVATLLRLSHQALTLQVVFDYNFLSPPALLKQALVAIII